MSHHDSRAPLPDDALYYYNQGREEQRLLRGSGQLEMVRTQEILRRYLPEPPATIFDIGGGAGIYAFWLARLGYQVHLIDAVPLHIEQAHQAQATEYPLASIQVGDARQLTAADGVADVVLLLGPLYHLTEDNDRLRALREAHRILKPGGMIFAAIISRFASLFDGLTRGFLADPEFVPILERDLQDGQHRNPDQLPDYFATAYFHHPDDLALELEAVGFAVEAILAIEGPGRLMRDFDTFWADDQQRERLLHFLRLVESEPTLLGISSHIMGIGRK